MSGQRWPTGHSPSTLPSLQPCSGSAAMVTSSSLAAAAAVADSGFLSSAFVRLPENAIRLSGQPPSPGCQQASSRGQCPSLSSPQRAAGVLSPPATSSRPLSGDSSSLRLVSGSATSSLLPSGSATSSLLPSGSVTSPRVSSGSAPALCLSAGSADVSSRLPSGSSASSRLLCGGSASTQSQTPPLLGQILSTALSQQCPPADSSNARSLFSSEPRVLVNSSTSPRSSSSTTLLLASLQGKDASPQPSFFRLTPAEQQTAATQHSHLLLQSSSSPSPQNDYASEDLAVDSNLGPRQCLSPPDNFLQPSPPQEQRPDSPASSRFPASPDTTGQETCDGDSGFSDNAGTGAQDPGAGRAEEGGQETLGSPAKRKRVRKSRAKVQDPQHKIIVKRTRRVRANDRERSRMHGLNDAMDELRKHLPSDGSAGKLTKIDTLRTASNYIKVLKMMLGELDKSEEVTIAWPPDMLSTLHVQPAASPDSSGLSPPPASHTPLPFQSCGVMSPPERAVVAGFNGSYNQSCLQEGGLLQDSFSALSLPTPMAGGFMDSCADLTMLGDSAGYGSLPASTGRLDVAGYGPSSVDSASSGVGMLGPEFAVPGRFSSAQTVRLQSSQCY